MEATSFQKIIIFLLLAGALLFLAKSTQKESSLEASGNYTTITISGKTVTIKAADGYTPTIETGKEKPMVILCPYDNLA
jgi:cytochrome oxidase Cu insertion factor (SCO1/SenC/PrrC family)